VNGLPGQPVQSLAVRATRSIQARLAVAVLAVVALAVSYGKVDSSPADEARPPIVENVEPAPGDLVPRQSVIEIDLRTGYRAELWVLANPSAGTWQRIPDSELTFIEGTGVHTWAPGPGRTVEEWPAGEHTLRVIWDTITGLPDVGEYEWSFRSY
jgi:hypothetical protein